MGIYRMTTDTQMEHAQPEDQDLLPEIVLDESAEGFVPDHDPPVPVEPELELELELEEEEVVVMDAPVLPPAPEQDNIFQTGKPLKKKRQASEKQRAHLDRIRAKALERKKEKANERAQVRSALEPAPAPAPATATPKVQPVPQPAAQQQYLTHEDVDAILSKYDERRLKNKESKRKEEEAKQLVRTHIQTDDVWEQCFR
jgi:hypothetical protein